VFTLFGSQENFAIASNRFFLHHKAFQTLRRSTYTTLTPQRQLDVRMSHQRQLLDRDTLRDLQGIVVKYNPYYTAFMFANERLAQHNHIHLRLKTIYEPTLDQRRYNRPTASEIAVLMPGTGEDRTYTRDIVVHNGSGPLRRVSELRDSSYCPVRYSLIHAYGPGRTSLAVIPEQQVSMIYGE
jgi:hypothetical protein